MVVYKAGSPRHIGVQHGRYDVIEHSLTYAGLNFVLSHNLLYSNKSLQGSLFIGSLFIVVRTKRGRNCCFFWPIIAPHNLKSVLALKARHEQTKKPVFFLTSLVSLI